MSSESVQHVTELLQAVQAGEAGAAERLLAVVYEQLHQVARVRMANLPSGQTLQPTALVHEAYLRLADKSDVAWGSRRHFFAAARAMRDILGTTKPQGNTVVSVFAGYFADLARRSASPSVA
jgi:RNA polymerase sigma factor (TIGR02999 family)